MFAWLVLYLPSLCLRFFCICDVKLLLKEAHELMSQLCYTSYFLFGTVSTTNVVHTLPVLEMDLANRRRQMIRRGSALVVVLCVWAMVRFRHLYNSRPTITYGPLSARDEQRQRNLSFIYNSIDTHCVELLRIRRAPFVGYHD